jgi:hypothetical protein
MEPSDLQVSDSERGYIRLWESYKDAVANRLPASCRHIVGHWSITRTDALALLRFLECYPREMVVLEIGTFFGISTFTLASHPKVSEVVSIDSNPSLADLHEWRFLPDPGPSLRDVRVLDLAEAVLDAFPEQRRKIRLQHVPAEREGVPVSLNGASLVAFVDGDHSKEGVAADLKAIFDKDSAAVAILHDCRGTHAPKILAGIASFLQTSETAYCFRLFEHADLGPIPPNLCVVYPSTVAEVIEQAGSGLLASPKSSLIQAAIASWHSWALQYKRADRHYEQANREQKLRKSLQEQLEQQRRDRTRELHDQGQRLRALKEKQHHLRSRSAKLEQRLRNRDQKLQRLMQGKRRLRGRTVRLKHHLESIQASRAWRLLAMLCRVKAKITSFLRVGSS